MSWFEQLHKTFIASGMYKMLLQGFRNTIIITLGALAIGVLGSAVAALPANVFSIWMNFSGSILAGVWSRRPAEPTAGTDYFSSTETRSGNLR